jgi:hypothetical protein
MDTVHVITPPFQPIIIQRLICSLPMPFDTHQPPCMLSRTSRSRTGANCRHSAGLAR